MTYTELQKAETSKNETSAQPAKSRNVFYTPCVDIIETNDELILYADLPGVKPGDVLLEQKGNELVLHAHCSPCFHGTKMLHAEYGMGDFYRAFTIAEEVDYDGIEASLKNGVLTVRVGESVPFACDPQCRGCCTESRGHLRRCRYC